MEEQQQDIIASSEHQQESNNTCITSDDLNEHADEQQADQDERASTPCFLFGPVANLCSATLGAGVLSIPFGFFEAGLVAGSILLILSAVTVLISIDLLAQATVHFQCKTYETLVEQVLGKPARIITEICILIFCLGCATAYIISIGDIAGLLIGLEYRTNAMLVIFGTICLPLSLLRRMTSLQLASTIGIFSIGLLVVNAILHFFFSTTTHAAVTIASILWPSSGPTSIIRGCPIFLFAFSCQVNVCQIYDELSPGTRPRFRYITLLAVLMCFALYTTMGVIALLDFGDQTSTNILLNYNPSDSILTQMAFGGMAVAVMCAFPLNIFPARVTLEGFARGGHQPTELEEPLLNDEPQNNESQVSWIQHVVFTLILTGIALVFALILPDISIVFGILGGVPSSLLGFCLPGMLGIRMGQTTKGYTLVVGGAIVGIVTTGVTVYSALA